MTDTLDLSALRAAAEAATLGPWTCEDDDACMGAHVWSEGASMWIVDEWHVGERNAAFIAAADPATVLALINRLEDAEAGLAQGVLDYWAATSSLKSEIEDRKEMHRKQYGDWKEACAERDALRSRLAEVEAERDQAIRDKEGNINALQSNVTYWRMYADERRDEIDRLCERVTALADKWEAAEYTNGDRAFLVAADELRSLLRPDANGDNT